MSFLSFRKMFSSAAILVTLNGMVASAATGVDPKKPHCECYCAGVGSSGDCFGAKVNLPDRDLCASYNGGECAQGGRYVSCKGVGGEEGSVLIDQLKDAIPLIGE